jgi:uncharacterized membrane protein
MTTPARPPLDEPTARNVRSVAALESSKRQDHGPLARMIDAIATWAGHSAFAVTHVVWFTGWLAYNTLSPSPFDPYPYTFLTLVVSLEAILLTSFVLAAQQRMTTEADRRAKLDLQINMLAEQELTAILRVVSALAGHAGIDVKDSIPDLPHLERETQIERVAAALEAEDEKATHATPSQG